MKKRAMGTLSVLILVVSPLAVSCAEAAAQTTPLDRTLDSLGAPHGFKEVVISPDGKRVAWVESLQNKEGQPSANSAIFVQDLASSSVAPRCITAGADGAAHEEHELAWSPDGTRLAFISDAANSDDFYVADLRPGAKSARPRQLTHLTGSLSNPAWSPDGKALAFLFIENAPRPPGPLQPMTKDEGVVEQHIYEQRLATVDVASGQVRQVSPADMYVYEYDWSPDGKSLVASAARGSGDNNWWVAELYALDVRSGVMRPLYKPRLQIAVPRWSPDGKSIAFIEGLMSDQGSNGGDIFVVPAAGGEARNVTPGMKASASGLAWQPDSNTILFVERVDGDTGFAAVDASGGKISTLWTGAEKVSTGGWELGFSLAQDGKTSAVVRDSFEHPPEVWAGPLGHWKQVTHANEGLRQSWGQAESTRWTSDGMSIQGWLVYPVPYDPAKRYPLVVAVHGGPSGSVLSSWPPTFDYPAVLSSQGYFVLLPNPRGSFGEGEPFTEANLKDFGYGDFRDIMAGVDDVLKKLPVDPDRIGITGWSYGGYMTMWAVTQTHRFRAAMAGAGIANWLSYYGENDIDEWMIPFFGASVYDDPAVYARSSPITFIKNVRTPTLILVGDSDGECPPPQSYEFWHALKTLGVKTQLVVYPHEGHVFFRQEHQRDVIRRAVEWFNQYLK
jgi:dipeptidyl aminopeptidase/acylaminoacyl peptidase